MREGEDRGDAVWSLDALDHLIVPPPWTDHTRRGKDHLVPAGLDVRRGQLAAIVELDPLVQRECIGKVIARRLPGLGHIPDDLGKVVGVQDEQIVVDGAHRLGHCEGLLLVRVQAGGGGSQGHPQNPSATRLFLRHGQGQGSPKAHERHGGQENRGYFETSHRRFSVSSWESIDSQDLANYGISSPLDERGRGRRTATNARSASEGLPRSEARKKCYICETNHLIASDPSSDQPSTRGGILCPWWAR